MTDLNLPPEEVMRQMAKIAMEQAYESVAVMAEQMAVAVPSSLNGEQALLAFAAAIRSTNSKTWPKGTSQ